MTLGDISHIEFASERTDTLIQPANASVPKLLNLQPRIQIPTPDMTIDLKQGALIEDHHDVIKYFSANIQPVLYDLFLALEAKNISNSIKEAKVQSYRAGAIISYS